MSVDLGTLIPQRRILERTTPAVLAVYLSHLIVRQADWSIHYHAAATTARYVRVAHDIQADLGDLCDLPG